MLRNSILYRRFYYVKKRNTVNIHIISKLISATIIFLLILTYVQKCIIPQITQISQAKAQDAFYVTVNSVVNDSYISNNLYNSLISSSVDKDGNIRFIQLDSLKAKKISIQISNLIDKKLKEIRFKELRLPFGILTGINALSKLGPIIHIRYSPFHKVETNVISTFVKDQKSFTLEIKVSSSIDIEHPLSDKTLELVINMPLKETILF